MGRTWLAGLTVALLAATLLVATVDDYGLTFDEPLYIVITDGLRGWFADVAAGGVGGLREQLRDERLRETWLFAARQNRNLPVPVLLSALFRPLGEGWPGPPYSYRLGTCLLLAATVALLFAGLAPAHGWEMAAVAAGSLLLMPQAFAHGHLAANDVAVSSFWLLAILLWLWSGTSARRALVAALVCGLGLACKASFVLVPALLGLWLLCFRQWRRWRATLVLAVVAPLVMLALCPMWWGDPLPRIARFYWRAFNASQHWTSDSYYLGTSYLGALPWHNGLVLPAVTTPPWTLALALAGAWRGLRRRDPVIALWTMGAGVLPFLRMLPNAPGHDGVRLMLPSLFCLAPLAGFGFLELVERFRTLRERMAPRLAMVAAVLVLGAQGLVTMHPFEMSYYSELIGGLRGAARLGFEVSYWYDAYTPRALREIQVPLPPKAKLVTVPNYDSYLVLLSEWGRPSLDRTPVPHEEAEYLLLYSRRGALYRLPGIPEIYEHGRPLWSLQCRGVQLLGLYRLAAGWTPLVATEQRGRRRGAVQPVADDPRSRDRQGEEDQEEGEEGSRATPL